MASNLICQQKDFPKEINLKLESPLISQAYSITKNKVQVQARIYEDVVGEIRKVILGIIAKRIKDPNQVRYHDEQEFQSTVELLKSALQIDKVKVEIIREETDKLVDPKNPSLGKIMKDNLTLKINYQYYE
jgi:hypothetical protein